MLYGREVTTSRLIRINKSTLLEARQLDAWVEYFCRLTRAQAEVLRGQVAIFPQSSRIEGFILKDDYGQVMD